jgi:hypothetical protein
MLDMDMHGIFSLNQTGTDERLDRFTYPAADSAAGNFFFKIACLELKTAFDRRGTTPAIQFLSGD